MHNLLIILIGGGVLAAIVSLWAMMHYIFGSHIEEPEGEAKITGTCGDTMELHLKFKDEKVIDTSCWTDGCIYSFNSLYAAAELAKGKTPDEILRIDADMIKKYIGDLPTDHLHCARLAEETLQSALNDYMVKITRQRKKKEASSK